MKKTSHVILTIIGILLFVGGIVCWLVFTSEKGYEKFAPRPAKETPPKPPATTDGARLLEFVDTLENFPTLTANDLAKILKIDLVETTTELDSFYVVKGATGENIAGFFKAVELRTPTETNKGGLLILDVRDDLGVIEKDILSKYPNAIPELREATAPVTIPYDWMVKKPWGKISFQITRDGSQRVVTVILDSID